MKIILCGYHWTGCKALELLLENNHDVFVYTHEAPYHVPSLADLCISKDIPYSFDKISLSNMPFEPDVICSIYYRFIIKPDVIQKVNGGIFNLHPSLLPMYRGCSSLTWAIINGEKEVGFTYHYIDEGCDTGNIILQKSIPVESWDTQLSLYNKVMFKSMEYFNDTLIKVINNEKGLIQKGESSYYPRGCPFDGVINPDWDEEKIKRFIRAMYFPPYPSAQFQGEEIKTFEEYKNKMQGQLK